MSFGLPHINISTSTLQYNSVDNLLKHFYVTSLDFSCINCVNVCMEGEAFHLNTYM